VDNPAAGVPISVWERQSVWSKAANAAKADIGRARAWVLRLSIAGAVLSTAAAQSAEWSAITARSLGALAAATLALVPILGRPATSSLTRDWTRQRSVSEALKTEVYTFLAGVTPYRGDDRQLVLLDRARQVTDQPDLIHYTAGIVADQRTLPDVYDVPSFIRIRLVGQINGYYRPKAAEYRRKVDRLHRAEIVLAALAAILAAVTAFVPNAGVGAWVGVVTTVAGAITAHGAAQRYEYQQVEFARTADQIDDLRTRYELMDHDVAIDDAFVAECEQVISIQNDAWMAKLVRSESTGSAPRA
jgi:SMODS and SLOG-associating 2TM effector domain 1/Protein of unknown function (DUF4231)